MEEARGWLEQFAVSHRGAIAGFFYNTLRAMPTHNPEVLVHMVDELLSARGDYSNVREALGADPAAAIRFAEWVMARERRPPAEKEAEKEREAEVGRLRHMESMPPTEKQLKLLARLGVTEEPQNRLHASELIEINRDW